MMAEEEKNGGDAGFLMKLGEKLYAHSRFEESDDRYAGVIKIDSTNSLGLADDAQLKRAQASSKLENFPLAIAFCEALIKRWPQSDLLPDATIYTAYYSDKAGRTADAIKTYSQYLEKWPDGEDAEWAKEQIERLKAPPSEN
jgi:TolA-binding protein